jgi:hypothetical protein
MGEDQQLVCELVQRRGYREGWTASEFLVRNVIKLQEELAELTGVSLPRIGTFNNYGPALMLVGVVARTVFDAPKDDFDVEWAATNERLRDPKWIDAIGQELADMQVVLFCAAEALSSLYERQDAEPFDLIEAALKKAAADVDRGVREPQ